MPVLMINHRIIISKPFKFLVGKNRTPVYVHNSLVARHSQTLNTLMNGGMSEARDEFATLDDVDPEVFARFAEWLYTGRYASMSASEPTTDSMTVGNTIEQHGLSQHPMPDIRYDIFGGIGTNYSPPPGFTQRNRGQDFYAFDASKRQSLWATFTGGSSASLPHPYQDFTASHVEDIEPRNDLMPHVKMYCFADKYGVSGLLQLTIDKIKQTMIENTALSPSHVTEAVDMIWYTLEHTDSTQPDDDKVKKIDKLRELVLQYATIIFEILFKHDDFKTLYSSDGDFALEMTGRLLGRLD